MDTGGIFSATSSMIHYCIPPNHHYCSTSYWPHATIVQDINVLQRTSLQPSSRLSHVVQVSDLDLVSEQLQPANRTTHATLNHVIMSYCNTKLVNKLARVLYIYVIVLTNISFICLLLLHYVGACCSILSFECC